jgi:hypothetical protein
MTDKDAAAWILGLVIVAEGCWLGNGIGQLIANRGMLRETESRRDAAIVEYLGEMRREEQTVTGIGNRTGYVASYGTQNGNFYVSMQPSKKGNDLPVVLYFNAAAAKPFEAALDDAMTKHKPVDITFNATEAGMNQLRMTGVKTAPAFK